MKKMEFIPSSEIKCPKSGIFANNYQLGKVILQISTAVFSEAVEKICVQRWLSPIEKIGPYAYAH